ncbi:VWA domain-containing protein [Nanoarchaeota archaeon]
MQFLEPMAFLLFIPVVLIIIFLIRKEFFKLPEQRAYQKKRRNWRRWIMISRIIIAALLIIALSKPYAEITRETKGDPRITLLIDNSTSMGIFDTSFVPGFVEALKEELPVTVRTLASGETSDIGEGILSNLEQSQNIMLITDGYNNDGSNLGDVSLFTSTTNSTISAMELEPAHKDVGVTILGPKKVVADLNVTYLIRVTKPQVDFYHLYVSIDGQPILDLDTDSNLIYLNRKFKNKGYHTIKAEVSVKGEDYFPQNNIFYKAINVIEKPSILYLSEKNSALEYILKELYEVKKLSSLPNNLDKYYAVIVNDMPEAKFRQQDSLSEYLIEGNGLVVFGGFNSFDRGGYKNSVFEQILPVKVGNAERKFSDNTIVIAIDRSTGGGKCRTIIDTIAKTKKEVCSELSYTDVIKAQAIELLEQLDVTNKVGAVAFDTDPYLLEPIDSLYNNKERMVEKISKIQPGGNTLVSKGILGGYNLLTNEKGNRYVILLTDGVTWVGDREETLGLAGNLLRQGIKVITVGIGRSVYDEFLKQTAGNGGGFYVSASNKGKLKVLFGDPEKKQDKDTFGLFVLNSGHFITKNMDPDATFKAFNQVLPKNSAELIITTDTAEPALTVWRYGLGKVAAWNVFTGGDLGELVNDHNSLLLTRTVNWAIGDPERKKPYFVNIDDGRVLETITVEVKSDKIPSAEGIQFVKVDKDIYESSILPRETGFNSVLDARYAVNYKREYEDTGFNPELSNIVSSTGGNLFKPDDIESIVQFVKSVSRRTIVEKTTIVWPFLVAAIILFLFEVMLRRISEARMLKK